MPAICAVVPDQHDARSTFLVEMLKTEGLFHEVCSTTSFFAMDSWPRLVLICGPMQPSRAQVKRLEDHARAGHGVLFLGTAEPAEQMLGIAYEFPFHHFPVGGVKERSVGEGYLRLQGSSKPCSLDAIEDMFPLHGFGCSPVVPDGCEVLAMYDPVTEATASPYAAITINGVGAGIAAQVAIDLYRSISLVQAGTYIDRDGIPPADGTAPLDDGILKAEDGLLLDWTRDRRPVDGHEGLSIFSVPVADAWRKVFLACIERVGDECGIALERVWYWPGGAPFVAMISHDSDGNDPGLARYLLAEVNRRAIHTTWCLQAPGYHESLCNEIRAAGHEIALHFDAYGDDRPFSEQELISQLGQVRHLGGPDGIHSNKNHYTRWEGCVEFFKWCAATGIRVDQSKGPSKCGTTGFPFGTCLPWQPQDKDGRLIDCLEICFQSQDFGLQGPVGAAWAVMRQVPRVNGVAHAIFHPAHAGKTAVNEQMHAFIDWVLASGGTFMTSKEIGNWWRDRLAMVASGKVLDHRAVRLRRDPELHAWVQSRGD